MTINPHATTMLLMIKREYCHGSLPLVAIHFPAILEMMVSSSSCADRREVAADEDQNIEPFGGFNIQNFIGKSPEEDCHDCRAPEFCHHVKDRIGPIADERDEPF